MSLRPTSRWYAVHCLSRREIVASVNLEKQRFDAFLPYLQKTRRHARKIDTVLTPLFPGYLFVRLDLSMDRWRSVNGTFGVARLVMQGDAPAPVPVGVIEALKMACDEKGMLQREDALQPGQSVHILTGPFMDFIGEVERLDNAGRVRILLNIMGGKVPIHLSREYVTPAADGL